MIILTADAMNRTANPDKNEKWTSTAIITIEKIKEFEERKKGINTKSKFELFCQRKQF